MKGRIVLILFALPFFGVGIWMLWSVSDHFLDAWNMRSWQATEARLIEGGYHRYSGDDSDTYEAYATYSYRHQGRQFTNDRVAIAGGADNIGDYQQVMGRRLSRAMSESRAITVYLDPDNPAAAVIDRDLRWGLIGFKSIFIFVFGGVGLGLIVWAIKAPGDKDATEPKYATKPWTMNDAWQTGTIRSNSKNTMYFTWGFAAFWNLISAPLPFLMYREVVEKKNYAALLGLVFTLVGICLVVWAVRSTREWKRFGPAPVTLDPYPGAIGGHVGGTVDVDLPFDSTNKVMLTLTNIRSYLSGSGKNRSRRETALWQDRQLAHMDSGPAGTRISFRFDVPESLDESDANQSGDDYFLWRLNLNAELPGTDIDRDYEIPVYATSEQSRHISHRAVASAMSRTDEVADRAVRDAVRMSSGIHGKEMYYPMGRNLAFSVGGIVVGAVFAAVGRWLMVAEGQMIFGALFGGIGILFAIACLYVVLNSLQVIRTATEIKTMRRILGMPIRSRSMRIDQIREFSKKSHHKTQSGNKHTVFYSVYANDHLGNKMIVGEGFKGSSEADAAIRLLGREFGIEIRGSGAAAPESSGLDVLAADS